MRKSIRNLVRDLRYGLPARFRGLRRHTVTYDLFSKPTDEEFDAFVEKRLDKKVLAHALRRIAEEPTLPARFSLLDVGCGPGRVSAVLRRHEQLADRVTYTGVDQSEHALAYATSRAVPGHTFVRRDVLNEDLPEGPFDVVMINEVVEHMPDYETIIRKVLALRPKVFFIATFAVSPESRSHRLRWKPETGNYMNTYSLQAFYAFLRGLTSCPIEMFDLGYHEKPSFYWFPKKDYLGFLVRLAARDELVYPPKSAAG